VNHDASLEPIIARAIAKAAALGLTADDLARLVDAVFELEAAFANEAGLEAQIRAIVVIGEFGIDQMSEQLEFVAEEKRKA
jgi:hypothetical protein